MEIRTIIEIDEPMEDVNYNELAAELGNALMLDALERLGSACVYVQVNRGLHPDGAFEQHGATCKQREGG